MVSLRCLIYEIYFLSEYNFKILFSNPYDPHLPTGKEMNRETVSYSLHGSSSEKIFKAFNALGTIAFSFGDAILPEIQVSIF